jgi:LysR family transcriptional regulator, hypochlorite-specific transcription factor HypT
METKWLEDFVSLAETRSFSRAAQQRHVTQPAFSRRIQSLEAWAGADLVDRSSYPTRLTPAGQTLHAQALELLQSVHNTRAMVRSHASAGQDVIEFAVPHTLAFTFFPAWVSGLRQSFGAIKSRLIALNVHDAVMNMVEGHCDILIAYHHAAQPIQLDPEHYDMVSLGQELVAPYCRPDDHGVPKFRLPGSLNHPLPYLGYAPGAYMGQMVDLILRQSTVPIHVDRVYETDMAEGLKAMALEGHGIAFLPFSAVVKELRAGRLVKVQLPDPSAGQPQLEITMEVRAYREGAGGRSTRRGDEHKRAVQALWDHLTAAPNSAGTVRT